EVVAGVQPCRQLHRHRRRDPARGAGRRGPQATAASAHARRRRAMSDVGSLEPTKLTVPEEAFGERLDRFRATHLGSRSAAERAVEAGPRADGSARRKSFRLEGGEEVEVQAVAPLPEVAPPPEPDIAWQDEH